MKPITLSIFAALIAAGGVALAQDEAPPGKGPGDRPHGPDGDHHRPPPPIIAALDLNHDGTIDADEIAKAPKSLLTLDKNGDGKLTPDELRPPPPPPPQDHGEGQGKGQTSPQKPVARP
jgi:hypothetical protein